MEELEHQPVIFKGLLVDSKRWWEFSGGKSQSEKEVKKLFLSHDRNKRHILKKRFK